MATQPYMGIFSDLHVLSRYGLVPPRYRKVGGPEVDPMWKYQNYAWKCWEHTIENLPPLEVAVINGDTYDGEDIKDKSVWVISTDMSDQYHASVETVMMLRAKTKKLYITRGTPYHEGKVSETLEGIAKEVKAEFIDPPTRRTAYVMDMKWHGLTFNFTHHMTRGWIYRGTASSRTSMLAAIAEEEGKVNKADVIVRSHLHMKHMAWNNGKWVILTPAYQVIKPWVIKTMEYYRAQFNSNMGGIVVSMADDGSLIFPFEKSKLFDYPGIKEPIIDATPEA